MTTHIAVYRGRTLKDAHIIAVSTDPEIVGYVAERLLDQAIDPAPESDPVIKSLTSGRRRALRLIRRETI
jgi:hypothetical protein